MASVWKAPSLSIHAGRTCFLWAYIRLILLSLHYSDALSHSKMGIQQILRSFCLRSCYWMLLSVLSHDALLHKSVISSVIPHTVPGALSSSTPPNWFFTRWASASLGWALNWFSQCLWEITVFIYSSHVFQIMDNIAWTSPCIVRSPKKLFTASLF